MARTETITKTFYTFDELSDDAKQKAIADNYDWNIHDQWFECVYDDAKHIADLIGLEIDRIYFSGFASQGDGACFEGSYSYRKNCVKLVTDYAPQDTDLHNIVRDLVAVQKPSFYRLEAQTSHQGRYYHSGCMFVNVSYWSDFDGYYSVSEKQSDGITEVMRDFADWIYSRLKSEYEYLTSDDAISESLIANDVEFTETGEPS